MTNRLDREQLVPHRSTRLARITRHRRPPIGTTFSFTLNEQASVRFSFTRSASGPVVDHRCVAPSHRNAHRKHCTRRVTAGELSFPAHAGVNKVVFQGRISAGRKLARGHYTLFMVATSAGLNSSRAALSFTIVK